MSLLAPSRRRGIEYLDDPAVDPKVMNRSMADVEKSNRLFGGAHAALAEFEACVDELPKCALLLDVGTGTADIPERAKELAAKHGRRVRCIGLDKSYELLTSHRDRTEMSVRADALALPFRDKSVDVVVCSQVLHHFVDAEARKLISEMNRVARVRVVISDLRRSVLAAGGLWVASFLLNFHSVSRHDGVVSIMRGFLPTELADLVTSAIGQKPHVRRRRSFRVTASWRPL